MGLERRRWKRGLGQLSFQAATPRSNAIAFFTLCTVPATTSDNLGHLQDAMSKAKLLPDRIFNRPTDLRAAQRLLSFRAHAIQSGHHPRPDHRSFEFSENRRHLHHGSSEWSSGVDALLLADQRDTGSIEFRHRLCDVDRTERPKRSIDQTKQISNRRRMASLSIWSVLVPALPPLIR